MNDRQNIIIVLLLVSAAMLALMLVMTHQPQQAQAGTTSSRYDDYILCPGAVESSGSITIFEGIGTVSDAGSDNIYVIDVQEQKLITYSVEPGTDDLAPTDVVDLEKIFRKR